LCGTGTSAYENSLEFLIKKAGSSLGLNCLVDPSSK